MTKREAIEELMRDADVAMLTTVDSHGALKSRPMALVSWENDEGDGLRFLFITQRDTGKVGDIQEDDHVNVSVANPSSDRFLSVAGRARIVNDADRVEEVWQEAFHRWFPEGRQTANLGVLEVHGVEAEYWDYRGEHAHRSHVDLEPSKHDYPDENDSDEIEASRARVLNEADRRKDRPEIIHPLDETID